MGSTILMIFTFTFGINEPTVYHGAKVNACEQKENISNKVDDSRDHRIVGDKRNYYCMNFLNIN